MKKTPMVEVRERWGSKEAAAKEIVALIGDPDGDTLRRLRRASNAQLLRLHAAGLEVQQRFGSREALEEAIVRLKFGSAEPSAAFRARMARWGICRLLEEHRQIARQQSA